MYVASYSQYDPLRWTCYCLNDCTFIACPCPDYTMANFVKPNLLGTLKEFSNRFINPISNGQCRDATPLDVRIMKRVSHVLHKLLSPCVQVISIDSLLI